MASKAIHRAFDAGLAGAQRDGAAWLASRGVDLGAIEGARGNAGYWHGTGRYQYGHDGESKFSGTNGRVVDVLRRIIADGGLTPHFDPYLPSGAPGGRTVSVAHSRMYARLYAQYHQDGRADLQYQYGSPTTWLRIISARMGALRGAHIFLDSARNGVSPSLNRWASSFHSAPNLLKVSDGSQRSDIAGNYGILFGIRYGALNEVPINASSGLLEARSATPIGFDRMTHVEVPLRAVDEVKALFKKHRVRLPVFAMEDVEAFVSRYGTERQLYS